MSVLENLQNLAQQPYRDGIRELRNQLNILAKPPLSWVPSEAIRQICEDLTTLQRKVSFNGGVWVKAVPSGCEVCLAGITMLTGRCDMAGSATDWMRIPSEEGGNGIKLQACYSNVTERHAALDDLRTGDWQNFLARWIEAVEAEMPAADPQRALLLDRLSNCPLRSNSRLRRITGYHSTVSINNVPELLRVAATCEFLGF